MSTILDCPGVDSAFLDWQARIAAEQLGLRVQPADSEAMRKNKARELASADQVLVSSGFHAQWLRQSGYTDKPIHIVPLWVDSEFWRPATPSLGHKSGPLRVLYAGKINLRKGVPYLIQAMTKHAADARLRLVGAIDREIEPLLKDQQDFFDLSGPCTKAELRRRYHEHDVLVLPSLGDAFGFVAMEAMACGLPVIVTENCGVPVPDPDWRVPVMNSDAIAARLALYAQDRERCRADGQIAATFARRFTPERYREQIKAIFRMKLASPNQATDDAEAALQLKATA